MKAKIWKILTFQQMISPAIIQVFFWAGVIGSFYGAYVLYQLGNWAWPFPLVFGPLLTRLIFEHAILAFRAYDRLGDIHDTIHNALVEDA